MIHEEKKSLFNTLDSSPVSFAQTKKGKKVLNCTSSVEWGAFVL